MGQGPSSGLCVHWTGRLKILTVLLALALAGALASKIYRKDSRGAEWMLDSVVAVEDANGNIHGSGVVLEGGMHVLTVNHVITGMFEKGRPIWARYRDGERVRINLIRRNRHFDIALLSLPERHVHGLRVASEATIRIGEPVYAIGHPFGIAWLMTSGTVSKKSYFPPDQDGNNFVVWTDAWIEGGSSGGPLVTKSGEVIGLVMAFMNPRGGDLGATHLNICVSGSEILRFLEN